MAEQTQNAVAGNAGVESHVPGQPATVTSAAEATGGIDAGNFIQPDIDDELFRFNSDDTPLMNLMLRSKRVKVNSPEVDHFMIDEPKSSVTVIETASAGAQLQVVLPLNPSEQALVRPCTTLLCKGISGYDDQGRESTPGKDLMLYVIGFDTATSNPVVRAVNGRKTTPTDDYSQIPEIPAGTVCVILANSLYETQKQVDPDLIVPQPHRVYLQKRGMNQVVSDYFQAQKKRLPFSKAIIAEQAITNFKVRGNRTLWAGRGGKFKVNIANMGMQYVYCTEGIRWQFKRELQQQGRWTIERIIALAKMFFTGEDVPKTALLLAGKNLLEQIQSIDFSGHPEIQITSKTNALGWNVTNFHTVFGDIEIKREPTLDKLGWSNSGALIGENRLVHYVYSSEHSFSDRVEGEEATREGILIWDALALKGACHIWIDGEGVGNGSATLSFKMWDSAEAPTNVNNDDIFYLLADCPGMSESARQGQMWQVTVGHGADLKPTYSWHQYAGEIYL